MAGDEWRKTNKTMVFLYSAAEWLNGGLLSLTAAADPVSVKHEAPSSVNTRAALYW